MASLNSINRVIRRRAGTRSHSKKCAWLCGVTPARRHRAAIGANPVAGPFHQSAGAVYHFRFVHHSESRTHRQIKRDGSKRGIVAVTQFWLTTTRNLKPPRKASG